MTQQSDEAGMSEFLRKEIVGVLQVRYGVADMEAGWLPECSLGTLGNILKVLDDAPDPKPAVDQDSVQIFSSDGVQIAYAIGHVGLTVDNTVTYLHNRA